MREVGRKMFIVKASHNKDVPSFSRSYDGYTECQTEEQAIDIYTRMINLYPSSIDVCVFETKEIIMPSIIKENAIKQQKEEDEIKMKMLDLGLQYTEVQG
jgi:hypothetical protein